MKKILILLLLLSLSYSSCTKKENELNMQPYLQAVTQNSIYVLLESKLSDPVTVEYSQDTGATLKAYTTFTETTSANTFVHNVHITGLLPGTKYNYSLSQADYTSMEYSFYTAIQDGINFRFAWLADVRSGPEIHNKIAGHIIDHKPIVSLYGGDLAVNRSYEAWKEDFFLANQKDLISEVPFFNAPGNHEGWEQNTMAFTQAPESTSGTQDFYSFDFGDMHVLVLNNQINYSKGSKQYRFADEDLKNSNKKWKVVICHNPPYGAGGHDEDREMKAMAIDLFDKYKVDVVFSGHSHFYQHNKLGRVHYITAGSAGSPLYEPKHAWYTIKSIKDYHFLIVDVEPTKMNIICYDHNNNKIDEILITK